MEIRVREPPHIRLLQEQFNGMMLNKLETLEEPWNWNSKSVIFKPMLVRSHANMFVEPFLLEEVIKQILSSQDKSQLLHRLCNKKHQLQIKEVEPMHDLTSNKLL